MKARFIGLRKVIHARRANVKARLRVVSSHKSIEWEGLTLSRAPSEAEALYVKRIAAAQTDGKTELSKLLIEARKEMIEGAVDELAEMSAAEFHKMIVEIPEGAKKDVFKRLRSIYYAGRKQVGQELHAASKSEGVSFFYIKGDDAEGDYEDIDELADLTLSRVANDVQSRATSSALQLAAAGLAASEFRSRLQSSLDELSYAPQEQAAGMAANRALGMGRRDEMEARSDEISKVLYSAILDANCCSACEEEDGKEVDSVEDMEPPCPNPSCEGADRCRCFWVAVFASEEQ